MEGTAEIRAGQGVELLARGEGDERRAIFIQGIVQGVGFRPFVYSLATSHRLSGWVRNDAAGVCIEAEGSAERLDSFLRTLVADPPPLATIEAVSWLPLPAQGEQGFRIEASRGGAEHRALISPDVATCAACLAELFDPANRRFHYPLINCTNCGPRFTITRAVPYDRPFTTMAAFPMCPACLHEYGDPQDRRFHAQPNACPVCGPHVRLCNRAGRVVPSDDPVQRAAELLRQGAVVALKGIGGYHLACDAYHRGAVRALRRRKARQDKPFALMARDLDQVGTLCTTTAEEVELLLGPACPIVLLERRVDAGVAEEVAPRQGTLGVMLAYTPLHHLLLHDAGHPLVMTSANRSDEPIAYRDDEAFRQLGDIADFFLLHDRPIHVRCDDSVLRVAGGRPYPVRRSRGQAPAPLRVPQGFSRHVLACGGELKNTFCLGRGQHAFLSHHIGDLENYATLISFRQGIEHYCELFDVHPELVAYDLHPDYLSTKYALELEEAGLPAVGIQHHHAHIASCLADNRRPLEERVIGVALDGTGYGTDGTIWGGEFLLGSVREGFARLGHLENVPLPGGSAAIRQPWRMAVAWLYALYGEGLFDLPLAPLRWAGEEKVRPVVQILTAGLNTPLTSSAGRLFDAVAALLDLPGTRRTTYEGQAAVELELMAGASCHDAYPVVLREGGGPWVGASSEIVEAVVSDLLAGRPPAEIATRFHRTIAALVVAGCERIRAAEGVEAVALSGGTFQNMLLLRQSLDALQQRGFAVYIHRNAPANDGGLALGQVVLADARASARR